MGSLAQLSPDPVRPVSAAAWTLSKPPRAGELGVGVDTLLAVLAPGGVAVAVGAWSRGCAGARVLLLGTGSHLPESRSGLPAVPAVATTVADLKDVLVERVWAAGRVGHHRS